MCGRKYCEVLVFVIALLHFCDSIRRLSRSSPVPPEARMSSTELAAHWGYGMETHSVRTEDGYTLVVHRVVGRAARAARAGGAARGATPVLFVHGIGCSDEVFLLTGRNHSLALHLADLGFDVWLVNLRGSIYSRTHVSLSPSNPKFWDFSWHENGYYDLAATVDHILDVTKQPSMLSVSHSMGGSATLVLLSERPEYNKRVRASFLMAPAAHFHNNRGAFYRLKQLLRWTKFETATSTRAVGPLTLFDQLLLSPCLTAHHNSMDFAPVCISLLTEGAGPFHSTNHAVLNIVTGHWPQGVSLGQMVHYTQILASGGEFRKYDYGLERNLLLYGTSTPPSYNLMNVKSPIFLFYADNDYQVHPKDLKRLASDLPGLAGLYRVRSPQFNHIDFLFDQSAKDLVYAPLIGKMIKYM